MHLPRMAAAAVVTLIVSSPLTAQCTGDAGFSFSASPAVAGLGDPVELCISAPAGTTPILFFSASQGPTDTPIGPLCVGVVPGSAIVFPTLPTGQLCLSTFMHCVPALDGVTFYMQYIGIGPGGLVDSGISNQASITAVDQGNGCNFCAGPGTGNKKPALLRMKYTGDDCAATSHSQGAGQVTCAGDPADAPLVRIVAQDDKSLGHQNALVWFDGLVPLGHLFDLVAANAGEVHLKGVTRIYVLDPNDGTELQMVSFHTSCSEPLHAEDQFGALQLEAFVAE